MTVAQEPLTEPRPLARHAVWAGLDHLPVPAALDFVRRVAAAGYGAFWTREGFGRDPFALFARLAGESGEVGTLTLGTSIANIYARDAAGMRAAALTVHEMLEGRFILGLGVSHAPWVQGVRGHEYGSPVATMERYLAGYATAPYRAATPFGEPRVMLAALRSGMLGLAGRATDGAYPYLMPPHAVADIRRTLDAAAAAAGRPRPLLVVAQVVLPQADPAAARGAAATYLRNYLALPAYVASLGSRGYGPEDLGTEPSERLLDDLVLWGTPDSLRARLQAVLDAGADQVAVVPLGAAGTVGDPAAFEAVAPGGGA